LGEWAREKSLVGRGKGGPDREREGWGFLFF
jgi:hypothetical protein